MSLERTSQSSSSSITLSNRYKHWLDSSPQLSLKAEPVKWTQEWERFLEAPRPPGLAEFYLQSHRHDIDELLISCYRGSYRDLCRIQHELSITACNMAVHHEFDKAWLGWTSQERRDFLQNAILRGVGCQPQYYEEIRPYCREVSIAFLEGSLLDVLKHCLLDDISQIPKTPIIYPIEFMKDIDEPALTPGRSLMLRYVRLRQTQLICIVLSQGLHHFAGEPAVETLPLKGNFKVKGHERKAYKAMPAACEHCREEETDPKNHKMQVCGKCKDIGRQMPYCSRECVKADWPRHKLICGKPLTVENATATAVPVDASMSRGQAPSIIPRFPAPIASRESRACSGRQNPAVDYFLCLPGTQDNLVSMALPDDAVSARFCAARDTAMSTGDLESVGAMFSVLISSARPLIRAGKYREEYLVVQVKKEFDVEAGVTTVVD
ncbi:hypothetical protein FB451DRAFT_1549456 [Mycena latifolia]|nr:hypothetical protein FB451DRAFT_1549456 [Mycena latifolia]